MVDGLSRPVSPQFDDRAVIIGRAGFEVLRFQRRRNPRRLELKTAISGVPLAEFGGEIEGHVARLCRRPGLEFVAGLGERGLAARAIAELTGQILAHLDATLAGAAEFGRASCRESVCQYG